ncbi:MAG: hypothetical protein EBQ96_02080 [Proteobacteria bacterium]|nr:hypothetical protein [Pseudomonadota bacterium]
MPRTQIHDRLFFDDLAGCGDDPALSYVHACKDPCHRSVVGYEKNLPNTHPSYLAFERERHLYLNLVDPPVPLFKPESFALFFAFVDREIALRPVLIHCNKGESRAPSLALLYAAKRLRLIPDESYEVARKAFEDRYPYKPGLGIATFLSAHWGALGS